MRRWLDFVLLAALMLVTYKWTDDLVRHKAELEEAYMVIIQLQTQCVLGQPQNFGGSNGSLSEMRQVQVQL